MSEIKPRLALVSSGIRRDLLAPLVYFSKFELIHFYQKSVYGDLTADDFDETLVAYSSPLDLYQRLVRAQPDVIQSVEPFSFYTQPFLWASFAAVHRTRAALVAVTFENRPLAEKFGNLRAALLRRVLTPFFARACVIITLNEGARANLLQCRAAPDKIVRALWGSWGVDFREFFPNPTRVQKREKTILFVGRLHAEKGVFDLLDAFVSVHEQMPDARLLYVGDGPARAALPARIESLHLAHAVTLCGTIKHRAIAPLFRQADIFCAPSRTTRKWAEQVGMSALQAMACGLPIVATTSGAIPEYIPDGVAGILVAENDARALADALRALLADPERARELGQRGYAFARAHYDAQANVARGEQLVMEHCLARRI